MAQLHLNAASDHDICFLRKSMDHEVFTILSQSANATVKGGTGHVMFRGMNTPSVKRQVANASLW